MFHAKLSIGFSAIVSLVCGTTPAPACMLVTPYYASDSERSYLVAKGTARTVEADSGEVAIGPLREDSLSPSRVPVLGHVVRVEWVAGASAEGIEAALRTSGREAVLIPWAHDEACWTEPYGDKPWTPNEEGAYRAQLRGREHWTGNRPTFDVFYGWDQPYPQARFLFDSHIERARPKTDEAILSPQEYVAFRLSLSSRQEIEGAPDRALHRLRKWRERNSKLASRWPAQVMLSLTERYLTDQISRH